MHCAAKAIYNKSILNSFAPHQKKKINQFILNVVAESDSSPWGLRENERPI